MKITMNDITINATFKVEEVAYGHRNECYENTQSFGPVAIDVNMKSDEMVYEMESSELPEIIHEIAESIKSAAKNKLNAAKNINNDTDTITD